MKKGRIYGVSLGPGDPGLITVKGLQALEAADKIYYPGSLHEDGTSTSYSLQILAHYGFKEAKLKGMFLKMSDNRTAAESMYKETFCEMKKEYDSGMKVAFVSEGDVSFYSTFAYLLEHINRDNLDVEIISGVPSFILGAAVHKVPLATLNEKIAVLPRIKDVGLLNNYLPHFDTIALIKIRGIVQDLIPFIKEKQLTMLYGEHLGSKEQYITTKVDDLRERKVPYFSLIIIKNGEVNSAEEKNI